MQSLAKATAHTSLSDPNAAAYIQSSVDMGTLYLRGASEEVGTINEMRRMARDRRNAFGQPIVTLAAGRPREGGITLTLDDLEHLLIDAGRDGWLNGEIIEAALRLHARDVPAYVMPAAHWSMYVLGGFQGRHPTTGVASSPGYLHSCAHGRERTGAWHISTRPICESATKTTPSTPFRISLRLAS